MKILIYFSIYIVLISCNTENSKKVTNSTDYDSYLATSNNKSYDEAVSTHEFWQKRLAPDSSGVGDLGPLAGSYTMLFDATGDVENLKKAELLSKKAIQISASSKDSYTRALAHNYISQHRFKEAKEILEESYAGPANKNATELMLFDVYMELGEYEKASEFLGKIKDPSDFNYIIRLAKWSDHNGDLPSAIKYLEKAVAIAESSDNKDLKIWSYSNIADFYGHAGRLEDSYNNYLKTLALQPDNAYAKKGIAWIAYSNDNNSIEAKRILDSISINRNIPDYHLLKADIAASEGNTKLQEEELKKFVTMVTNEPNYGAMYNTYLINVYAETDPSKALVLAEKEIMNRATPETYQLLAYAQLANNKNDAALKTIENHVIGKTSEPKALFHAALVYKANGKVDKVKELKEELLTAKYELGPTISQKIEKL